MTALCIQSARLIWSAVSSPGVRNCCRQIESLSLQALGTIDSGQITIKGTERQVTCFPRDFEH